MTISIIPPPELVQQWLGEYFGCDVKGEVSIPELHLAARAAQWGANHELESCCEWVEYESEELRAARRPKPTSLKEQALAVLENEPEADDMKELVVFDVDQVEIIRRALEQLDD